MVATKRYIVLATCMGYIKMVHTSAKTELAAFAAFKMIFPGLTEAWTISLYESPRRWQQGRIESFGGYPAY